MPDTKTRRCGRGLIFVNDFTPLYKVTHKDPKKNIIQQPDPEFIVRVSGPPQQVETSFSKTLIVRYTYKTRYDSIEKNKYGQNAHVPRDTNDSRTRGDASNKGKTLSIRSNSSARFSNRSLTGRGSCVMV